MNVEALFSGELALPDSVQVDDVYLLTAVAHVIDVRRDLLDIRRLGERDASYVPGDLNVRLLISDHDFAPKASAGRSSGETLSPSGERGD